MPLLPASGSLSQTPLSTISKLRHAYRRRYLLVTCAFASVATLIGLAMLTVLSWPPAPHYEVVPEFELSPASSLPLAHNETLLEHSELLQQDVEDIHSPFLLGPPTQKFRDNLRNDTKYITSWISAGWTNDVMTYANLIYLGSITDRVPIIALFTPSHIGGDVPPIAFGEVFDVPRFIRDSGIFIVEWDEVKDPESDQLEDLGCWNVWEAVQNDEHIPRRSTMPDLLGLDISYTRGPDWLKLIPNYPHDKCSTFWALARLAYPEDRNKSLGTPRPSTHHQAVLHPDEQLLCYDYLYYACSQQSFEFDYQYAPNWRYVGRHFRWTQEIDQLASQYVNRAFGLPEDGETPPYIAIHVRHGDFNNWCWAAETPEDCFAPIPVIARRVKEVQDELRTRRGIEVPDNRVIMTSDEKDPAWWTAVTALGWAKMDHALEKTEELHGRWYPVILDAAVQSNGMGFVGTDRSTFSILSRRRVEDWHGGATRTVKWGSKDADAHRRRRGLDEYW